MKRIIKTLKSKNWPVILLNLCAVFTVIQSVNVTCGWIHHQPEVPEEAFRYRKF